MSEPHKAVPAVLIEKLALGELDSQEAAALRERLGDATEPALARIADSNAEILADYPAQEMAARIRQRAEREQPAAKRRWPYLLAPTLVAAAAMVWVVVGDPNTAANNPGTAPIVQDAAEEGPETTRIKGGVDPHVVIDRRTADGHERLAAGERVAQGDQLQISYVPAGRRHGVIVSIDGAGAVTLHHPATAEADPALSKGKEIPLDHSYELDDAPGYERFIFVTREDSEPPVVAEVLRAARELAESPRQARSAPLSLAGNHWRQQSLLLRKRGGRGARDDGGDDLGKDGENTTPVQVPEPTPAEAKP